MDAAAIAIMKPSPTDSDPLPHRCPKLLPLTGLTASQIHTLNTLTRHRQPPLPVGRPWGLPLPTHGSCSFSSICEQTQQPGRWPPCFGTSQSAVDPIIHHLVPVLARRCDPIPTTAPTRRSSTAPRSQVHYQSITTISQELSAQHQHPDHHLLTPAPRSRRRLLLARQPQSTSSSPARPQPTSSPASATSSATVATASIATITTPRLR